ncbi:MAG TPA: MBL fold metallo-hydrolase [Syntrophales bacterium]|nr:MBL fold metallo-hydrolase [Syntrophales bacterium]
MNYSLVVNGFGNAFLQEFGCPCPRCARKEPVANVSVSILGREDDGRIAWHVLVDVGLGVVNSLRNTFRADEARVDWLLFTHWHPDHSLELNRLGETMRRTARRRGEPFSRIPTWCREGTGKWLAKNFSYEWHRCLDGRPTKESEPPGTLLDPVPLGAKGISITPVSVSHAGADISAENFKERRYNCACFVVQTATKKTALLWDLDGGNTWIANPETEAQRKAVRLLSGADYLLLDCFSWSVEEVAGFGTGHLSFATAREFARALRPRETLLVHMGGHEDGEGNPGWGWTDRQWEDEALKLWRRDGLPGTVRVPVLGEEITI